MSPAERLRRRIERRAKLMAPELGRELLRAWDRLAASMSEVAMARAIARGGVEALFSEVLDEALLNQAFAEVQRTLFGQATGNLDFFAHDYDAKAGGRGWQWGGSTAGAGGVAFGSLNPRVIEGIRQLNLKMADTYKTDVRETVRAFVENGIRDGVNPRTMARGVRKTVGLTGKQQEWVQNFRRELETGNRAALRRALGRGIYTKPGGALGYNPAHAGGIGVGKRDMATLQRVLGTDQKLSAAQIDRMVDAYTRRMTALHSETLARTAALDSMKWAKHESTQAAIEVGALDGDRMVSERYYTEDSRTRDAHRFTQVVRFGEPFSDGEGGTEVIPGTNSYNCRCGKFDRYATKAEMEQLGMVVAA